LGRRKRSLLFAPPEELQHLWPGWTFTSHGDDYRWHEQLTGEQYRTWDADVAQCKKFFCKELARWPEHDSALVRLAKDNAVPMDELFDSLLQKPLPPARFIGRNAVITPPLG